MDDEARWICEVTGATTARRGERIQSLWSGYGELLRVQLSGAAAQSVVLKRVQAPRRMRHPRGWDGERSHRRKLRSYEVEAAWYRDWSARCDARCRVPACLAVEGADGEWRFLLEDLDAAGFADRRGDPSAAERGRCLAWLAEFHALFLDARPDGLWPSGTYWHLATRPDELAATRHPALRRAAPALDARLAGARHRTLVHGDAKVANVCFAADAVAAVDFQYVGGGCGVQDVAYFLSSCLDAEGCEAHAAAHLDAYFVCLREALARHAPRVDAGAVEAEWRALYPVAWADFYRFLAGWSPGHWKLHGYARRLTEEALRGL